MQVYQDHGRMFQPNDSLEYKLPTLGQQVGTEFYAREFFIFFIRFLYSLLFYSTAPSDLASYANLGLYQNLLYDGFLHLSNASIIMHEHA